MKRFLAIAAAAVMLFSLSTAALANDTDTEADIMPISLTYDDPLFSDVPEAMWYADAVNALASAGIMNGTGEGCFTPSGVTSRGMIVTILYRLAGSPDVGSASAFDDTASGAWYTDAATWAAGTGLVSGVGNNCFAPNADITREQMAKILYAYAQSLGADVSAAADLSVYSDADRISTWAQDAMRWTNAEGIITGRSQTTLVPQGTLTRAEAAVMLQRLLARLEAPNEENEPVIVGGWTMQTAAAGTLPQAAQTALDKALAEYVGVSVQPVALLATQVVAGTNYCILAEVSPCRPDAVSHYGLVYVYAALDGSAEILKIADIDAANLPAAEETGSEALMGGWTAAADTGAAGDSAAQALLDDALGNLVGAGYQVIACIGTQVVAGTNYCMICKCTTVTAQPYSHIVAVYIYKDLSGTASVTDIVDLDLGL